MRSRHFEVPREWPWLTKGAIYKPHLEKELLPFGAGFCEATGHGGGSTRHGGGGAPPTVDSTASLTGRAGTGQAVVAPP
jgi:hypothetical protein